MSRDNDIRAIWSHEALCVLEKDAKMREKLYLGFWTKVPWWRRVFLREKPKYVPLPAGPLLDKINMERKP